MSRFWILLKKELRDMITIQTLLPMIIVLVVFSLLGQFIGSATQEAAKDRNTVTVIDLDNTTTSQELLARLTEKGYDITLLPASQNDPMQAATKNGQDSVLVLEKGFEQALQNGDAPVISVHTQLTSFAMLSAITSSQIQNAADELGSLIKEDLIAQSAITHTDLLEAPLTVQEHTHVNGKSAQVSSGTVQSIAMSQTIFVPMIIFIIVVMASQMTATAIANEKGDKTLETLLSTPVSRLAVLFSKMTAAGIGSLFMSIVFLLGFSSYMGALTGEISGFEPSGPVAGMTEGITEVAAAMNTLGLTLSPMQLVIIGVELFTTILIALAISTMLGALAEDIKGIQTAITPIMFCVMIPYLISLFADITALPVAARTLLYLIPFTHTFVATAALVFGNYTLVTFGILYQLAFLALSLFLAVRLFSSDKLFTTKLKGRKGKKSAAV